MKTQLKALNSSNLAKTTNGGNGAIAAYLNGVTLVTADGKEYALKGNATVFGLKENTCQMTDILIALARGEGIPDGESITLKVSSVSLAKTSKLLSDEEVKSISLF